MNTKSENDDNSTTKKSSELTSSKDTDAEITDQSVKKAHHLQLGIKLLK